MLRVKLKNMSWRHSGETFKFVNPGTSENFVWTETLLSPEEKLYMD